MASLLTNFLVRDSRDKAILIASDRYTGLAFKIMSTYPEIDNSRIDLYKHHDIRGLSVFDEYGTTVYSFGTITRDPRIFPEEDGEIVIVKRYRDLLILNITPQLLVRREARRRVYDPDYFFFEEMKVFIHMEIRDEGLNEMIERSQMRFLLVELFLILFCILIVVTYLRSQNLKKQLDEQKNLVTLGTALRTLTHEMKNPLSIIQLQCRYLKKKHPELSEEETGLILAEVDRLSTLMDTVRSFLTRPTGDAVQLGLREFFGKQNYPAKIAVELPEDEIFVRFEPERFRSLMDNLLNNARESGSAEEDIRLSVSPSGKRVMIRVEDRGAGMSREVREKIFDPFFTTKTKGTGAGLMIVKKLLDEQGSSLQIDSEPGRGTSVWFMLNRLERTDGKNGDR
jgi:signal transduction histidine kinase